MATISVHRPTNLLIFEGQSLNLQPSAGTPYPQALIALYTDKPAYNVVAIGGVSMTTLYRTAPTRCWALGKGGTNPILIITGGSSDIYGEEDTGATVYSDMGLHSVGFKAANASGKVICCTITKSTVMTSTELTNRTNANTLIKADASHYFDQVVDIDAVTELTDPTNTTYFSDGTHYTTAGAAKHAAAVKTKLDLVIV